MKVIFTKVPDTNNVTETINGEQIDISWAHVEVIPVESKSFLFGEFNIPERSNFMPWILGMVGLGLLIALILAIRNYLNRKSKNLTSRKNLKNELLQCASYDDIVLMWRQKRRYLDAFPMIEKEFKEFEEVLFKYQFKPQRTEQEISEVSLAYEKFKASVTGALHGI